MNTDLTTPIGNVSFSVSADLGNVSNANLETKRLSPTLPPGMVVKRASAVLLVLVASEHIKGFRFSCTWPIDAGEGDVCTGEALAAWEWVKSEELVVIGTEEGDYLGERLGLGRIDSKNNPVKKYPNQIVIEIDELEKNKKISIHFVIAENKYPEKQECSCWFAVDIPHKKILSEFYES